MGEEFSHMVAHTDFKASSTVLPFVRVGLCATQVTCPRDCVKDGISRMVTKSDIDRLRQKKIASELLQAEQLMAEGWKTVEASPMSFEQNSLAYGKFQLRLMLFLLGKELKGREKKQYPSMEAIRDAFQEDLQQCPGQVASASTSSSGGDAPAGVKSLQDASDPKAIALASNKHISVGKHYVFKNDMGKVWKLEAITDSMAKLVHQAFFGAAETYDVLHSELKNLKQYTKPVPELVQASVVSKLAPTTSPSLEEEILRCKAQCAFYEKYCELLGLAPAGFYCFFLPQACPL